jgi:hypothetical protein
MEDGSKSVGINNDFDAPILGATSGRLVVGKRMIGAVSERKKLIHGKLIAALQMFDDRSALSRGELLSGR